MCHVIGDKSDEALLTANLGWVALKRGQYAEALDAVSNALVILQALGDREYTLGCLAFIANIAAQLQQTTRAATLGERKKRCVRRSGSSGPNPIDPITKSGSRWRAYRSTPRRSTRRGRQADP